MTRLSTQLPTGEIRLPVAGRPRLVPKPLPCRLRLLKSPVQLHQVPRRAPLAAALAGGQCLISACIWSTLDSPA